MNLKTIAASLLLLVSMTFVAPEIARAEGPGKGSKGQVQQDGPKHKKHGAKKHGKKRHGKKHGKKTHGKKHGKKRGQKNQKKQGNKKNRTRRGR